MNYSITDYKGHEIEVYIETYLVDGRGKVYGITGDVIIDGNTISGQHGLNDYERDFGFVIS